MWDKIVGIGASVGVVVLVLHRRYASRPGPARLAGQMPDWKHGDVLLLTKRSRCMLLWPPASMHPLLVLERQGKLYVLHVDQQPYTAEGEPLCPRAQSEATQPGVVVTELGDVLERQKVVVEAWRSPTFPASTQTYEAVVAKANKAYGQSVHGIGFMALLLQMLGYFGQLTPQEVLGQATPGGFQKLLQTSSFQRFHTLCA